jgi:hypothetical protein
MADTVSATRRAAIYLIVEKSAFAGTLPFSGTFRVSFRIMQIFSARPWFVRQPNRS